MLKYKGIKSIRRLNPRGPFLRPLTPPSKIQLLSIPPIPNPSLSHSLTLLFAYLPIRNRSNIKAPAVPQRPC